MGLDMYLSAERYLWSSQDADKAIAKAIGDTLGSNIPFRVKTVSLDVGYWRKANHIHKWFVENVQDGDDDCRRYSFELDKLFELRDVCIKVLNDHSLAKELLPTGSGFFFGSTDYDEYYFEDIKDTLLIINNIIGNLDAENYSFVYQSSW